MGEISRLGGSKEEQIIKQLKMEALSDDAINIQFTSVCYMIILLLLFLREMGWAMQ